MIKTIGYIKGDGIGPEIVDEALKVLIKISEKYDVEFEFKRLLMGGESIDKYNLPITNQTIEEAKRTDAILMGSVGGERWNNIEKERRPEQGLLKLRKSFNLYANLRVVHLYDELKESCPLKNRLLEGGLDILIVRELTGGIYFGNRETIINNNLKQAIDTSVYNESEIKRVFDVAVKCARSRNKKIVSVDKANVLDTSRLWREISNRVADENTDIKIENMLVDNCAMQLVNNPQQFDVIVTENMFGDILSDQASVLAGSIGMMPSASLNETNFGLYEPSHGSAPDIEGQNKANPIATILSAAMMLRYSFSMEKEANFIEKAVKMALELNYRTEDIMEESKKLVTCSQMGDIIAENI